MKQFDVIVIGGGPAGAAASITLSKHSTLQVALIEAGDKKHEQNFGETTSPALKPLLEYLDALQSFEATNHEPWNCMKAAWGSNELGERHFLFSGTGSGWHLNRNKFDAGLIDVAREKGTEIFLNTKVTALEENKDGWLLITTCENELQTFSCKYLIDTSGRKSILSRTLNIEQTVYDRLACYMVVFKKDKNFLGETILETSSDGWWCSSTLPGNKVSIAFMTDVDIAKQKGYNSLEKWAEHLCHTHHIYPVIENGIVESDLIIRSANTRYLNQVCERNWISAGEACISFDPLSSMGIGYALSSGIHAARLCKMVFKDEHFNTAHYKIDVEKHFKEYYNFYKQYYALERRWKNEVFWKRRQGSGIMNKENLD